MQIYQLIAGIDDGVAGMPLFRLHVVDIAVDMAYGGMIDLGQVALGIGDGVHQAHFGGTDGLDGGLDAMLLK